MTKHTLKKTRRIIIKFEMKTADKNKIISGDSAL